MSNYISTIQALLLRRTQEKVVTKAKIQYGFCVNFFIPELIKLEELYITRDSFVINRVELSDRLANLQRMGYQSASADEISMFICRSPKLNRITVCELSGEIHFNKDTQVLNLEALNNERKKLKGAQKVTIHLRENIFLATKRALNETNFSLIQLKSFFDLLDKDYPQKRF